MIANLPEIFEGALAMAIVTHATGIDLPRIRTWQAIDADARWEPSNDYTAPYIAITASPPETDDETQRTQFVSIAVTVATSAADDRNHRQLAGLYAPVQYVIDRVYAGYMCGDHNAVSTTFVEYVAAQFAGQDYTVHFGGMRMAAPEPPAVDGGELRIGLELEIHYSRSDI